MRIIRVVLLLLIVCPVPAEAGTDTFAINLRAGESINGFPNWGERVMLEWINRARVDPQVEMRACGAACGEGACYRAVAPLSWNEQLNRSARFHADEMTKQHFFAHDSKCQLVDNIGALYPVACDGSASCACGSGAATGWATRIALFGGAPAGEIIATPAEPNTAFYAWLYEPYSSSSCGFGGANGHRYLILTSGGAIGLGASGTGAVGDFGGLATPYKIPSAAHYPKQAATVALWANWYDTAAPRSANAVVNGSCVAMTLQRGTQQNGAYSANATNVGSGCHRYYFSFVDSSGAEVTYPATGSLGIGDSTCDDWNASRLVGKCSTGSPGTPAPPVKRRAVKRH